MGVETETNEAKLSQSVSLLHVTVPGSSVLGCTRPAALEPWQLGAGHTVQVRLLDHMASKALLTKNKDLLSTKTHVGCRDQEAA